MKWDRVDLAAIVLLLVVGGTLIWFGGEYHRIEATETAESDRFVEKAQAFRDGQVPADPYRPLLYPLLAAGAGELLDDTFGGARLVSTLSALVLLIATAWLGRRCFGRTVGLLAAVLLAANVFFIEHAVVTTTDMLFAALLTITLLALTRSPVEPGRRRVVLVAGLFAAALFTRYAALGLLPCIVFWLATMRGSVRARAGRLALFGVATLGFLVPHFVLTHQAFGDPFHQANLQNLFGKLYDSAGTVATDAVEWGEVAGDPGPWFGSAWNLARAFVAFDFGFLAGNKSDLLGPLFTGLLALGLFTTLVHLDRRRGLLLLAFGGGLALVFASKLSMPRTVLPLLPLAYLFVAHFLTTVRWSVPAREREAEGAADAVNDDRGSEEAERHRPPAGLWPVDDAPATTRPAISHGWRHDERAVTVGLVALLVALQVGALVKPLVDFIDRHPHAEIDAAVWLQDEYGAGISVAGVYAHIDRHTTFDYHPMRAPRRGESGAEYHEYLESFRCERDVDFVLLGRVSLRARLADVQRQRSDELETVFCTDDVAIYRARAARP